MRSSDGNEENCSGSVVYSETSSSVRASVKLPMISRSSSTSGRGMIIMPTITATPKARTRSLYWSRRAKRVVGAALIIRRLQIGARAPQTVDVGEDFRDRLEQGHGDLRAD